VILLASFFLCVNTLATELLLLNSTGLHTVYTTLCSVLSCTMLNLCILQLLWYAGLPITSACDGRLSTSLATNVLRSLSQGERRDAVNCQRCNVTISQLPTNNLLARLSSFKLLCRCYAAHALQSWCMVLQLRMHALNAASLVVTNKFLTEKFISDY